ncbi:MAG: two-component system response regulator [Rhodocyclaceae bacterium]|nr:two-component system response regulator [Rhodocyclaceae bacterium]
MTPSIAQESGQPTILVVDDAPESIEPIVQCLHKGNYRTRIANTGERALALARALPKPDLILLDVMMPGLDGYAVCERLKADPETRDIPVIFLTVRNDECDEQRGFDVGAVDYIAKPISPPIVLTRIRTHLTMRHASNFLRDRNAYLEREVDRRTREVGVIQDATIMAMASLAETRDAETGNHIRRTQKYVHALAEQLRSHPRFGPLLSDENIHLIYKSAPLHDIGKVGIPDRILLKPGKLSPDEFEIIKRHPRLGHDAIVAAERMLGLSVTFLRFAKEIAGCHHEKWDGTGYPDGLKGNQIPVAARLMAIADVYDALISERVYKKPFSHESAVELIVAGRGTQFDPDVTDAFLALTDTFREIARRYADPQADLDSQRERLRLVFGETH